MELDVELTGISVEELTAAPMVLVECDGVDLTRLKPSALENVGHQQRFFIVVIGINATRPRIRRSNTTVTTPTALIKYRVRVRNIYNHSRARRNSGGQNFITMCRMFVVTDVNRTAATILDAHHNKLD